MKRLFALITLLLSASAFAAPKPRTQVCDFTGDKAASVYQLFTVPGIGTTFRLPEGWKITDFVVTDPKNFQAESNGTFGIVTPLSAGKATSISIYTDNDRLFVFYLISEPDAKGFVDQLVTVQSDSRQLFSQKVNSDARKIADERIAAAGKRFEADMEQNTRRTREQLLFSLNTNYRITGNLFDIDRVADDGIFTYIRLARSQERPVVYLGDGKDLKHLEPVKYTDEGGYYIVHRVLGPEDKGIVLRLGNRFATIRRNK